MTSFWQRDVDDVFSYCQVKTVLIRDWRVGGFYMCGLVGAGIYLLVVPLYLRMDYLDLTPLIGHIDYRIVEPAFFGYGKVNHTALSYCSEYTGTNKSHVQNPCYNYPVVDVAMGSTADVIVLMSRTIHDAMNVTCLNQVTTSTRERLCSEVDKHSEVSHQGSRFVAHLENFSMGFVSAVSPDGEFLGLFGYDIPRFAKQNDGTLTQKHGWEAPNGRVRDYFTLNEILDMADCALDDLDPEDETFRTNGMNINFDIDFQHDHFGNIVRAVYSARATPLESRNLLISERSVDPESRAMFIQYEQRKCIKLHLSITGNIGTFSFSRLLTACVSAFGLIGLLKITIAIMLLKVHSHRSILRAYLKEQTVDMSDFRERKDEALDAVDHALRHHARMSGEASQAATDTALPVGQEPCALLPEDERPVSHLTAESAQAPGSMAELEADAALGEDSAPTREPPADEAAVLKFTRGPEPRGGVPRPPKASQAGIDTALPLEQEPCPILPSIRPEITGEDERPVSQLTAESAKAPGSIAEAEADAAPGEDPAPTREPPADEARASETLQVREELAERVRESEFLKGEITFMREHLSRLERDLHLRSRPDDVSETSLLYEDMYDKARESQGLAGEIAKLRVDMYHVKLELRRIGQIINRKLSEQI